jgi:hypothetical protein
MNFCVSSVDIPQSISLIPALLEGRGGEVNGWEKEGKKKREGSE